MKNRQTVSWGSLLSFCSSDPGRNGENKTVQEEYGAKGYFGFSALSSGLPVSSIVEIADQEGFSAIELSHDQLENLSVMQRKRILEYFPVIVAGSFVSGSFASGILSCPPEMLDTFAAELENLFRKFAFLNIRYLSFDLPLNELFAKGDDRERKNLTRLLKKLLPILTQLDQELLLPLRVPSSCKEMCSTEASCFIRESMCARIKLKLEVHPHELSRDSDPYFLASLCGFDCRCLTFHYNADRGETLVKGHVQPWLEYLCRYGFRGPVFVSPFSGDGRFAMTEANGFAALLKEIRKNSAGSGVMQ